MLLIVGLGNYPDKYKNTRHNFGFKAIDALTEKFHFSPWRFEKKFFSFISTGEINGEKIIACKPKTFMNLSGKAVLAISKFYKIPPEKCIILTDDLDLPFGKTRRREKGSSGGQKGVEDVLRRLGSQNVPRIKFGIDAPHRSKIPTDKFVLSQFLKEEKSQIPKIIENGLKKLF